MVQTIEVCLEDFKSRIPGLFPYVVFNADGTLETHAATDSNDGCYGKIVDNIKIPSDVNLIAYISVQEENVNNAYVWDETNTIPLSVNLETVFGVNYSMYLRKVVRYEYVKTENCEEAIFVESIPNVLTDDSPSCIKTLKIGADGSVVGCEGVVLYDYYKKNGYYKYYARKEIIKPCKTYSYKTIISNYYKYKNIVGSQNTFIKFVEDGIGYIKTDKSLLNVEDINKYPEVPDFIYLSQVKQLKNIYDDYKEAYVQYRKQQNLGTVSSRLRDKAEAYVRMGGDNFTNWLGQITQKAYDIANYYKCLADNKDFPVRFNVCAQLVKRGKVVGIENVYENFFVGGNRYYDGDILTYEGKTYICKLDRISVNGNNYEYIQKNIEIDGYYVSSLLMLNSNQTEYVIISNANIYYVPDNISLPEILIKDYIVYKGQFYRWVDGQYSPITVTKYSTGVWNNETKNFDFDFQHFIPISEISTDENWYTPNNTFGENFKYFVDVDYIPTTKICEYIRFNDSVFQWDEEENAYIPSEGYENRIVETTDSKLKSLRTLKTYINVDGNAEEPGNNEDWLYFYHVGNLTSIDVETDSVGNIVSDSEVLFIGQTCYDLHAYGNIIDSITYNEEDNTVTFVYIIGAHLLAVFDGLEIDVDGNFKKKYRDFSYDASSKDGVVFTETYECKDDSIRNLGDDFDRYVSGDVSTMIEYSYQKFPFITIPLLAPDNSTYIEGTGVGYLDAYGNMQHSNTIKKNWTIGLYHQPNIKNNAVVDRGNGASFERHIRLGEIHSMEEMVSYQNGSYYRLSEK